MGMSLSSLLWTQGPLPTSLALPRKGSLTAELVIKTQIVTTTFLATLPALCHILK